MAVKKGRGQEKQRNTASRKPKRIVLIAAEGANKTETNYFDEETGVISGFALMFLPEG